MGMKPKWEKTACQVAMVSPSLVDMAWAAGFLEGEGAFTVNHRKLRSASACVRATQKQLEPLMKIHRWFGGTVTFRRKDGFAEWRTYGARARGIMMTLFTMLSPRRRNQIRLALRGGL